MRGSYADNPGNGRRRFHRLGRLPPSRARNRCARRQRRQADLCRQPALARNRSATGPRYTFIHADICDRGGDGCRVCRARARRRDASGRREPCRPLDHGVGRLHPHQRSRHAHPAGSGAGLLDAPVRPTRRPRFRFLHVSTDEVYGSLGADGVFTRTTAYDPSSPYSASKAACRPSGQRLAPHLRAARGHLQLLEQLRAVSFSRKADPADDHQRAGRASRCPSTATAPTCATGSTWKITPARSI